MLYTIIYGYLDSLIDPKLDYFHTTILNVEITLRDWLCHTGTIIVLILLLVALGTMVVYLFKLFANMWR